MKIVLKNEIDHFMNSTETPCVSLYLNTYRSGAETLQNPIKMKNLLKRAEKEVESWKLTDDTRKKLFQPIWKLVDDYDFWQHQLDGLAVFASPGYFRHYQLPYPVQELSLVARQYHLKPLMPLYTRDDQFFLLALDQKRVRLYEGNRYSIREMPTPDLPKSLAEALQYDDYEKLLNFHVAGPGGGGNQPSPIYHGQGGEKDTRHDQLLRFFREIDKGLHEYLRDSHKPLVLAGVEYYFPIFQEASDYPHLMKQGIKRAPESINERELHKNAWEIVGPTFREEQNRAAERYRELAMSSNGQNKHKTADQFEDVIPAAFQGRIETLFALRDHQQWGTFEEESLEVEPNAGNTPDRKDLLDFAALHTLRHKGNVFLVAREHMPEESPVAAILRY